MHDTLAGTWKLNPGDSKFDPNHKPKDAIMVFEREADGAYLMQAHGTNAKGEAVSERPARFVTDGSAQPVPDFPGLACVATKPDPNTIRVEVRREDGSVAGGGVYAVSADGATLKATTFGFDSQLRQFEQHTAWDRCS